MSPSQKALFLPEKQGKFEVGSRSIPSPGAGQLLVKVQSAALNPVDYKIQDYGIIVTNYPTVLGTDIAGTVEELGEGVDNFCKGDKVLVHGEFINDFTAFQEYTLTNASYTAKIPPNESFDSAATVPVGLDTALVGLYGNHFGAGVTPPWVKSVESNTPIVIFGGSSSVGSYVVKEYGATHFFNRNLSGEQLKRAISKVTDSPIKLIYDAISLPETQSVAWELLANDGTLIVTLFASVKEDEGKERKVVHTFCNPHTPQNEELCRSSWALVEKWLSEGTMNPNKYEVLPNGLEGIIGGLERMRLGQISGTKLVAHPQETQ
ncbi:GroES-like protein [Suillus decipiens]|nr:GroES-like protein [Suillus decipiens]